MKKNILFSLLAFLIIACSQKQVDNNIASIKGEVLSGTLKNVKFEWIVDNSISGNGETYTALVDSNSNFSIDIPIERIATGRITVGKFYHDICLIPGDNFFISIDADTIKYLGKGAEKNNYLYQAEVNGIHDWSYYHESNKCELTPNDFLESLKDFKQRRMNFLNSYLDSIKLQKEFVDFYIIETKVAFENQIQGYPRRYSYRNRINEDSLNLPEEFLKLNDFSYYVDDSKTISSNYISNLRNQLYDKARDITLVDTSMKWNDAIYIALFDSLSGKTKEYVLTKWIVTEFSRDNYDSIAIEKFNEIEKDKLSENTFLAGLNKYNEKQSLVGDSLHQEFSNTLLKDTNGIQLTFGEMMNKYKGNVVYLDLWSMSCGPCISAMPYAKELKEKLANEPIEFVYASLDNIKNKNWEKVFETTFTDKNHYIFVNGFNSRLHKFMEINWVPNYMIFDKEGKLIDFNADRPSILVEETESKLEKTLKDLAKK